MKRQPMKVVLFCGGYGMRMRGSGTDNLPKPMQMVGPHPLLWHVMRYYAHHGHTDFILCLGYGAQAIKEHFLRQAPIDGDFTLHNGTTELLASQTLDWRVTFVDTGLESEIGERLRRVRHLLDGEEMFLANYADVLHDADLPTMIASLTADETVVASVITVPPQDSSHVLETDSDRRVRKITAIASMDLQINGGLFILRQEVFDYLEVGGDLITGAYARLASEGRAMAHPHSGFWRAADTFKERAELDRMWTDGDRPWAIWEK